MPQAKFKAPARARERICAFGIEGVGKTRAFMQIMMRTTGSLGRVNYYIIETDNTYDEMLESPDFAGLRVCEEWIGRTQVTDFYNDLNGNIFLYRVRTWEDYVWAMSECFRRAKMDDWICIDNISNMWGSVQTWYTIEAYGKDPAQFALEIRKRNITTEQAAKAAGKAAPKTSTVMSEKFQDWSAINPMYMENIRKHIQDPRCHLFMMAEQKVIDMAQEKDKEIRGLYGAYGVRPGGQKSLGYDARTVLLLTKTRQYGNESYQLTSVKDRERGKLDEEPWTDFVDDYLVKVGGWRLAVEQEVP